MRSLWFTIALIVLLLAFLPSVRAFGAGEIPGYAFLKGQVGAHSSYYRYSHIASQKEFPSWRYRECASTPLKEYRKVWGWRSLRSGRFDAWRLGRRQNIQFS